MPEKTNEPTKPQLPLNNALGRLIIEAIKRADGYKVPESTLVTTLTPMLRPPPEAEDFRNAFLLLSQRELIGFELDRATEEKMWFFREKGEVYAAKL